MDRKHMCVVMPTIFPTIIKRLRLLVVLPPFVEEYYCKWFLKANPKWLPPVKRKLQCDLMALRTIDANLTGEKWVQESQPSYVGRFL